MNTKKRKYVRKQNKKRLTKRKIIALGGISKNNQKKLKLTNTFGLAGISYFE